MTGNNAVVAGGFAALNLGSLDQVYAVGHVQGTGGATLGGLVGANNLAAILPDIGGLPPSLNLPAGTATNSYWDMQTTAQTTSAGGTGMNTAVLSGGLPPGFSDLVWDHHSYPFLVNIAADPPQNTTPGPPVIPPVGVLANDPFLPPPDQQINPSAIVSGPTTDPVPNAPEFVQQQQQQQAQQGQGQPGLTTGSTAQDPIRLDVGENRFFYLPPLNETRLISDEVVLQMPCNVPKPVLDEIIRLHNLTTIASQCLQEGGTAAFRMRHTSSETVAAVIRALAAHQVIAAAQANYVYTTQETSVQSATSQQGDPGQYVPEKLRLLAAHRIVTGNGIPIAVIDSEIDVTHPDLTGTIANRYDATGVEDARMPTAPAWPARSYRTRSSSASRPARASSRSAPSPRAPRASESTTYHILRGIDHAVANNARIVNMSFAGPRDPSIERALKAAYDKGMVLIAAAGNAGPRAPALYPGSRRQRDRGHRHRRRRPAVHRRQPRQSRRYRGAGRGHPGAGAVRRLPGHDRDLGRDRPCQRRGGADAGAQCQAHAGRRPQDPYRQREAARAGEPVRCRADRSAAGDRDGDAALGRSASDAPPGRGRGDTATDGDGGGAAVRPRVG